MKTITVTICLWVTIALSSVCFAGELVSYTVDGSTFEGYYTHPGPGLPLVFLIHDWDGLTDYEMKRADMLAEMGYAVFAADLFGAGIRPTAVSEKRRITGALYEDREKMRTLLNGALQAAGAKGGDVGNAVAIGYCFGGTAVLEWARSGVNLKGFVSFHGGLGIPEKQDYGRTAGKLLIFHGTADKSVPMAEFAALAAALEENGVAHEMTTYGGAPHAFTVFGSQRYREDADKKSWRRLAAFLGETLK